MPYTPSPSQAQGMPLTTTLRQLAARNERKPCFFWAEAGAGALVEPLSRVVSMVTSSPKKRRTSVSASATRPFEMSHPGLW